MKNFLFFVLVFIFFILSFFIIGEKQDNSYEQDRVDTEKKAVFFSYIEIEKYFYNKSTKSSKSNVVKILDNLVNNNFNVLILHVVSFSDSIYPSVIYPLSNKVKYKNKDPEYDILKYFIEEAKKRNIEIHAWINPYRISSNVDLNEINENHPSYKLLSNGCVKSVKNKGIYYSPGCSEVNELIISGIKEIVNNYKIDGIHFDDYFYPDKEIDLDKYNEYVESGGKLTLEEYRYENVLTLIKEVYSVIKSINKDVVFGISPEGNIDNNYNNHYLNIKKILSETGYVDYIMPQIYFGFENSNKPFVDTLKTWNNLIKNKNIKLLPALAFYKSGNLDKYAGNGKNEWIDNSDIIKRQIIECRNIDNYYGFSLFRYDYIFNSEKQNEHMKNEFNNLKDIM